MFFSFFQLRYVGCARVQSESAHAVLVRTEREKRRVNSLCRLLNEELRPALLLLPSLFVFTYKQSLHAVNSSISRLHFTFRRTRRTLLFCGSGRTTARAPLSEFGQQKHQVQRCSSGDFKSHVYQPGFLSVARLQTASPFFPPSPLLHFYTSAGDFFPKPSDHGCCNKPGDEPSTPGVFPDAGRHHRGTGDTRSEARTRNRQIRPQGAEEETEPGGVDYRPANGPLRLWGKDTNNNRPRNRSNVLIRRLR